MSAETAKRMLEKVDERRKTGKAILAKRTKRALAAPISLKIVIIGCIGIIIAVIAYYRNRDTDYLQENVEIQVNVHVKRGVFMYRIAIAGLVSLLLVTFLWFRKAVPGYRRTKGSKDKVIQSVSSELVNDDGNIKGIKGIPESKAPGAENIFGQRRLTPSRNFALFDDEGKFQVDTEVDRSSLRRYLASSRFVGLSKESFELLSEHIEWVHLSTDKILFREGDDNSSGLYIVVRGTIGIFRTFEGEEILLSEFSKGHHLGEDALLGDTPRSFTCGATSECDLLRIPKESFEKVASERPEIIVSFIRTTMARHWRAAHASMSEFFDLPPPLGSDEVRAFDKFFDEKSSEMKMFAEQKNQLRLNAGETFIISGDSATNRMYVVLQGKVCIENDSGDRVELGLGSVIGALSFFTAAPHEFTARAITLVQLFPLRKSRIEQSPEQFIVKIARRVALVMRPTLTSFATQGFQTMWLKGGSTLYSHGDLVTHLYIIINGRLRVFTGDPALSTKHTADIGRGSCVGEMSMISNHDMHAGTVVALRDTELVTLSVEGFRILQESCPAPVLRTVSQCLAERLRCLTAKSTNLAKKSTIALVPLSAEVDTKQFAVKVKRALQESFGKVCLLNESLIHEILGDETADLFSPYFRSKITQLLGEHESSNHFILLEAGQEISQWTRSCLRQADLIFLIAYPDSSPIVSDVENDLFWSNSSEASLSNIELVLVHPDDEILPSNTRKWFRGRELHAFHHVRMNDYAHYARIARYISGHTTGVVLSGGGARGLAHLGVLKCLEEQSIPVDYICGVSQGSLMAALYAKFESHNGLEKDAKEASRRMGDIWDLLSDATFPIMSYFSGYKFNTQIKKILGENTCIEDLWIPYFCITTNVSQSDISVHRTGPLWRAVRASMTLLEYLPPMWQDGDIFIDGGYINNLPVDVMNELYVPELTVAVDVENKDDAYLKNISNYGDHLSGSWVLLHRLWCFVNPFAERIVIPRYSEIVNSLSFLNHNRNIRRFLNENMVDLYLRPELGDVKLLDYHKYSQIVDIGYKYATAKVTEWKLRAGSEFAHIRGHHARSMVHSLSLVNLRRASSRGVKYKTHRLISSDSLSMSYQKTRSRSVDRGKSKRSMSAVISPSLFGDLKPNLPKPEPGTTRDRTNTM
eukprot:718793_1